MPQHSVAYAVARVRVSTRDALDTQRIERLLSAATYEEALRTLSEIGWSNAEQKDIDALAAAHVKRACHLVHEITPDAKATDCLLYPYDIQNLKVLIKARCLGQEAQFLSECGTLPVDLLRQAVSDQQYKRLPGPLPGAMDAVEKSLAMRVDPFLIDRLLDQALYAWIYEELENSPNRAVMREYFDLRVDVLHAIMLLRVRAMGRDKAFYESILLTGGRVDKEAWLKAFDAPGRIPQVLEGYGQEVKQAAESAIVDANALPGLERAMENAQLALFTKYKHETLLIQPVIGYLLGRMREAQAVRLILAGKKNGFDTDAVRERLRALYGE